MQSAEHPAAETSRNGVERNAGSVAVGDVMRDSAPLIRRLGLAPYEPTWRAMQRFTDERDASTPDEIWLLEHPPVFTLGMNASRAHLLAPGDIPVVQIDRGGQVTYHGPGQLVVYPLIDLRRRGLGLREMVAALENAVIGYMAARGVAAVGRRDAPGVYVSGAKLASIGLRIRRGASYHGMALNVSLDPEPFQRINVCGYTGLAVTRLADHVPDLAGPGSVKRVGEEMLPYLLRALKLPDAVSARSGQAIIGTEAWNDPAASSPYQSAISTDSQAVSSR